MNCFHEGPEWFRKHKCCDDAGNHSVNVGDGPFQHVKVTERNRQSETQEGTKAQKYVDLPGDQLHPEGETEFVIQDQPGVQPAASGENEPDVVVDYHQCDDDQHGALHQNEEGLHLGVAVGILLAHRLVEQGQEELIEHQNHHIHAIVDTVYQNGLRMGDEIHDDLGDGHQNTQGSGYPDDPFLVLLAAYFRCCTDN